MRQGAVRGSESSKIRREATMSSEIRQYRQGEARGSKGRYGGNTPTSVAAHATAIATTTVIGTFFGYRRGRVRFCLHDASSSRPTASLLLLEFTVPTAYLAREMQQLLLCITLECSGGGARAYCHHAPLFGVSVWSMYYNGRKVGFAIQRQTNERDIAVFKLM
ncbi:hypothetical protein Cni_G17405 [Canna indica]|uniref:Uncharacterized protein n=1 Tax=Canna indica TaxID=4628 RepID=A0AAQ3KHD6_9LILI|nr:hypothetical protein Cni_G17405 [Canna indica]